MPKKKSEEVVEKKVERSDAYKRFAQLIEDYKAQNPEKYELKKEALEAQLNSL